MRSFSWWTASMSSEWKKLKWNWCEQPKARTIVKCPFWSWPINRTYLELEIRRKSKNISDFTNWVPVTCTTSNLRAPLRAKDLTMDWTSSTKWFTSARNTRKWREIKIKYPPNKYGRKYVLDKGRIHAPKTLPGSSITRHIYINNSRKKKRELWYYFSALLASILLFFFAHRVCKKKEEVEKHLKSCIILTLFFLFLYNCKSFVSFSLSCLHVCVCVFRLFVHVSVRVVKANVIRRRKRQKKN